MQKDIGLRERKPLEESRHQCSKFDRNMPDLGHFVVVDYAEGRDHPEE